MTNYSYTATYLVGIKERDMKSILDWFNERKDLLYKLCSTYFTNQHDVEDVFHQAIIRVYDGIHKVKSDSYFNTWVITILLNTCREVAKVKREKGLPVSEGNAFFDQLEEIYKEPVVLSYLLELQKEEIAYILQLPLETVKTRIYQGIEILCQEKEVTTLDSCPNYQSKFPDYLGKTLNRAEKVELEIHIHTCQHCQNSLSSFQAAIFTITREMNVLKVPSDFMEKVNNKVEETLTKRTKIKKKRTVYGLATACLLTILICIGFLTNSFTYIHYSWIDLLNKENDEQLLSYLKRGLGEELNLEEVSNGVKVKIKSVIADDVQTLIYYEVEDLKEDNQYAIMNYDGLVIANEFEVLKREANPRYRPLTDQKKINNDKKNVYKGSVSVLPISSEKETIQLKLTKLLKIGNETTYPEFNGELEFVEGEWSFDIPVKKHPSIVHKLDKKATINGIPITFKEVTIAPTETILYYSFQNPNQTHYVQSINIGSLKTEEKEIKPDFYGGSMFFNSTGETVSFKTSFETLFPEKPKEISVHFDSINLSVLEKKRYDLDMSKDFPQTLEYLGNKISIDKVIVGNPTKVFITYDLPDNRPYETLQLQIRTDNEQAGLSMGMSGESVMIDRNGKRYNTNEYANHFERLEQPRIFQTSQTIELSNEISDEQVIPTYIEITGYNTTKYIDDTIKLSLE